MVNGRPVWSYLVHGMVAFQGVISKMLLVQKNESHRHQTVLGLLHGGTPGSGGAGSAGSKWRCPGNKNGSMLAVVEAG